MLLPQASRIPLRGFRVEAVLPNAFGDAGKVTESVRRAELFDVPAIWESEDRKLLFAETRRGSDAQQTT